MSIPQIPKGKGKSKKKLNLQLSFDLIFETLIETFKQNCQQFKCENIPTILLTSEADDNSRNVDKNIPQIRLVSRKIKNEHNIEKAFYRNYSAESGMLLSLQKTLEDTKIKLVTLKLEDCWLTSEHISIVGGILQQNPTIQNVSVSGNPNPEQNHYLLLSNTHLLYLSLKFCKIDAEGVQKIATILSPVISTLKHLNLASNCLFDEGAKYVADFLRTNRSLTSINLADNKIRNKGCFALMEPLTAFTLREAELVVRRRIVYNYLKTVIVSTSSNILNQSTKKPPLLSSAKGKKKRERPATTKTSCKASLKSLKSAKSKDSTDSSIQKDPLANLLTETAYHPFIHDAFQGTDNSFFCKGNDIINSLNLSYNRISFEGLHEIIRTLSYQSSAKANTGLTRLILEGNVFGKECVNDLNLVGELLESKKSSLSVVIPTDIKNAKFSTVSRRRRSSSKSIKSN